MADPGLPDLRSAPRFPVRMAWLQRWTVLGGMAFGILWTGSRALVPYGSCAALWRSWQSA